MSRLMKAFLVTVLAVSMMVMGPLSATATPLPVTDPATTFEAENLTAALAAELSVSVGQITAVQTIYNEDYDYSGLVAGLDTDGNVFLAHYDFDSGTFSDWTDAFVDSYPQFARVTAITKFEDEYSWWIGGTADTGEAILVDACDYCVFGHSTQVSSSAFDSRGAVAGLGVWYEEDYNEYVGITTANPPGFFIYNHIGGGLSEITETVMPMATGPVLWTGGFMPTGLGAQVSTSGWLTGGSAGNILAYGDGIEGQVYANLPGIEKTFDIDPGPEGWMLAGRGTDGYMKLFKDTDTPVTAFSTGPGPVQLNLPQTMTETVVGEAAYPYYIIGGTGTGAGHLYKYKSIAGQFIDFDYLVAGMDSLNAMAVSGFFGTAINSAGPGISGEHTAPLPDVSAQFMPASKVLVGGAGNTSLILLTETPLMDLTPVPAGNGSSAECGDGTASVVVPDGAINADYNLLVEKVASGTPAVPGGLSLLGNSYEFECFDALGMPITEFAGDVTITIHYDEADLNGMSEDSLIIYYFDTADDTWKAVTPCVVDKVNNTVTIQVSHFSQFGILGVTATAMPYTGI